MTSLDEYLSRFSMHRKNSPCLTQSDSHLIKTKLEAIIKQALFHWKQNSVSSDQTRWISLLRACDGLWSDKYGENFHNANTSQNSSNLDDRAMRWWNVLSDSEAWWSNSRVISATASSDSRLFLLVEMPKQLFVPSVSVGKRDAQNIYIYIYIYIYICVCVFVCVCLCMWLCFF